MKSACLKSGCFEIPFSTLNLGAPGVRPLLLVCALVFPLVCLLVFPSNLYGRRLRGSQGARERLVYLMQAISLV
jgi:hypothetical protein